MSVPYFSNPGASSPGLERIVVPGEADRCSHRGRESRSLVNLVNTDSGRGRRKRGRMVRCVTVLRVVAGLDGYVDIVGAG